MMRFVRLKQSKSIRSKDKMNEHIEAVEEKNKTIDAQDQIIKVLYDDISDKADEKQKYQERNRKENRTRTTAYCL